MKLRPVETILAGAAAGADVYHSAYRGVCPQCLELCDGVRLLRSGRVYGAVFCPEHGRFEVLLSSDADWFQRSLSCIKPATRPLRHARRVREGCPSDCGLCPEHGQHSCLPIIEITDHCNMECPICLVDNRHSFMMSRDQFAGIVDTLIAAEGSLDTINLSGGEPTLHPDLLALVDLARRPEIARVSMSTNGIELARDPALCRALAERRVYVSLQMDGFDERAVATLRGVAEHLETTRRALANLEAAGVRTTLVFTAAEGVNDHLLGDAVELLLGSSHVLSLMVQPLTRTGRGRGFGTHDAKERLTIPEVVDRIVEHSGERLACSDFMPLPCSHPSCFALTYLLETGDDWVPFPRFLDFDRYLDLLANRGTMRPDQRLEQTLQVTIDELWSGAGQVPDSERILGALKRLLCRLYPEDVALDMSERLHLGEASVKTIFIHAFMDATSFELERVRKCCTHYALPDGRLMPACAHNVLHRPAGPPAHRTPGGG